MPRIIPAILEKDITEIQKKLDLVKDVAELVQVDIADGKFVDNTTIKLEELKSIKTDLHLEIHLMVENPREYFQTCQELGAYRVFWHYEADSDIDGAVAFARTFSFKKGLVLNQESAIAKLQRSCQCLDGVMLMGIVPGKQGQAFIPATVERVRKLREVFSGSISVDGGVSEQNIKALIAAGATDLVTGSALFGASDVAAQFHKLESLL